MDTLKKSGHQFLEEEPNIGDSTASHHIAPEKLKELSHIDNKFALLSLLETLIALTISILLCRYLDHPVTTIIMLVFIGTRQHYLKIPCNIT